MSSITLRSVRSFVAVADLGGFRKAAEKLSISQPSLSAHVRELEGQLGMTLLRPRHAAYGSPKMAKSCWRGRAACSMTLNQSLWK
jgi:hypothetical protein